MGAAAFLRNGLVAVAILATAVFSGAQAASNVYAVEAPLIAKQIGPLPAKADRELANAMFRSGSSQEASLFAVASYATDPLAGNALAVIARELKPGKRRDAFMVAAATTSKRGTLLQGTLLEFYTEQDNLNASVQTLDRVVKTYPKMLSSLTPLLANALAEDGSIPIFRDLLSRSPPWMNAFLIEASSKPELLPRLVELRRSLPIDVTIEKTIDAQIMKALIEAGNLSEAQQIYQKISDRLPSPINKASTIDLDWASAYPPFDWTLSSRPNESARVAADDQTLGIYIRGGNGGDIAQRLVSSTHSLNSVTVNHRLVYPNGNSSLSLRITCFATKAVLLDKPIISSPAVLTVSDDTKSCTLFSITIYGRAWSNEGDIEGDITEIMLDNSRSPTH